MSWKERERRVEFRNTQGEKLVGSWVSSSSPKTVVLCHGFSDHRDTPMLLALTQGLDASSISTFRFDFSGNGESEGSFEFGNYSKEVEDLRSAIEYLRSAEQEVYGIVGHSKAGGVVLLYAARYDDVDRVINISGRFDMQRGVKERYGADVFERLEQLGEIEVPRKRKDGTMTTYTLTKRSMDERLSTNMEAAAKAIKKSHVLTIHGTQDAAIPVQDANSFASCIANHALCIVDEADHNFTNHKHLETLVNACIEFLE